MTDPPFIPNASDLLRLTGFRCYDLVALLGNVLAAVIGYLSDVRNLPLFFTPFPPIPVPGVGTFHAKYFQRALSRSSSSAV